MGGAKRDLYKNQSTASVGPGPAAYDGSVNLSLIKGKSTPKFSLGARNESFSPNKSYCMESIPGPGAYQV